LTGLHHTTPNRPIETRTSRVGRPSKAERFRAFVADQLAREPAVPSIEILRRARHEGYDGGKSALYELVASLRPRPERGYFDGLPGESSQHDFGQADVRLASGVRKRLRFFASRLTYSRWTEVTLVPNDRAETLAHTLLAHFRNFGGIPLLAIFDQPRTVARNWSTDGLAAEWNSFLVGLALDLGLGLDVRCASTSAPRRPTDHLVNWVKNSFFHSRRFIDEADVANQLALWRTQVNTAGPGRNCAVTPAIALQEERRRLRPIKVTADQLALRAPIVVGQAGMVVYDSRTYLMPEEASGMTGVLFFHADRVRIVAGPFEAIYSR
jgi:transposase